MRCGAVPVLPGGAGDVFLDEDNFTDCSVLITYGIRRGTYPQGLVASFSRVWNDWLLRDFDRLSVASTKQIRQDASLGELGVGKDVEIRYLFDGESEQSLPGFVGAKNSAFDRNNLCRHRRLLDEAAKLGFTFAPLMLEAFALGDVDIDAHDAVDFPASSVMGAVETLRSIGLPSLRRRLISRLVKPVPDKSD